MKEAKVGDLVELLDRSSVSSPDGSFRYFASGIVGIVTEKEDLTQMPIVTWLNIREAKDTWPQHRLRVISEALNE